MKKLLAVFVCLFSFLINAYAATTPVWEWGHNFNGTVVSIDYHNDYVYTAGNYSGGPLVYGSTTLANQGGSDIFIAKWDTLGNLIWAYNISGTGEEQAVSIKVDSNEDIIFKGTFSSTNLNLGATTFTKIGSFDLFVCKINQSGNFIWAQQFGSSGNYLTDGLCLDSMNNIYFCYNTFLEKFTSSGNLIWSKDMHAGMSDVLYSSTDNTVVIFGGFFGTFTLNGITLTAAYSPTWGPYADLYLAKVGADSSLQWLQQFTTSFRGDWGEALVNQLSGNIYIASSSWTLSGIAYGFSEILPNGNWGNYVFNLAPSVSWPNTQSTSYNDVKSISGKDSFVSVGLYGDNNVITVYNVMTHKIVQISLFYSSDPHLFMRTNAIYAIGSNCFYTLCGNCTSGGYYSFIDTYSFGKLGNSYLATQQSIVNMHTCLGTTVSLTSNIIGGTPPITYSWSPSSGLSSANTDTTSFTATSNTTYILTATDATGAIVKDTFNIYVDTPLAPIIITPQFPTLCADSMILYSNLIVVWHKIEPIGSLTYLGWGINKTIYDEGKYLGSKSNYCGLVTDTIEILQEVDLTVTANPVTVCIGDSIVLSASSTTNVVYNWSAGVTNNLSFIPVSTQTYTVTATDTNGCYNRDTIRVPLNAHPIINSVSALPNNFCGSGNSTMNISTSPSSAYCIPVVNYSGLSIHKIENFNFNSGAINNNTSSSSSMDYTYYPSIIANVIAGSIYSVSISSYGQSRTIWVDFNEDGDFNDAGELCFFKDTSDYTVAGFITIPLAALNGLTRMRVASKTNGTNTSCYNSIYGEYEDYQVNISGGVDHISWSPSTFLSSTVGNIVSASNINTSTAYTVTVSDGNNCTTSSSIFINVNTIPTVTASASDSTVCVNDSITLIGGGSTLLVFSWTGGVIDNTPFILPSTQTYTVTGMDGNKCTNTASITIEAFPLPNPQIIESSTILSCINVTGCKYEWTFNGTFIDTTQRISNSQNGTYIVTVTDTQGCSNSDTLLNAFSIYPNPTNGIITINYILLNDANVSIKLTDMTGRIINELKHKEQQSKGNYRLVFDLNSSSLSEGMYLLSFYDGKRSRIRKVMYKK